MQMNLVEGRRLELSDKCVLVLGGAGMVGHAICRLLLEEQPKKIVVHSLGEEAGAVADELRSSPACGCKTEILSEFGDIFVREELKTLRRSELLRNADTRKMLIADTLAEFSDELAQRMTLWQIITRHKPDIVIDCINTSTAIAYQNLYEEARQAFISLEQGNSEQTRFAVEHLLCSLYIPQLVRHTQILHKALKAVKAEFYLKIGTTGTGGMGLNIPYTHGEEKPSQQLMSKSAIAGAHTLLLYLMYASPDLPIVREIKPSAAIAWKDIGYGLIRKKGKSIDLYDCPPSRAFPCEVGDRLDRSVQDGQVTPILDDDREMEHLKEVYIDTGENGLFSRGEFTAITTQNQMEFITPEEIAASALYEIRGSNTGHDVLSAIRSATAGPSYRAGFLRPAAIQRMRELEREHGESVAFEILGPPKLSKLLFECYLLKTKYKTLDCVLAQSPESMEADIFSLASTDAALRSKIISVGIPILLPDGRGLLRGREISTPEFKDQEFLSIEQGQVDRWAKEGWVDLRSKNWEWWRNQLLMLRSEADGIPQADQNSRSSFYTRTKSFWTEEIDVGEVVGWIFINVEGGRRRGYRL
jgi:hypothetical protein